MADTVGAIQYVVDVDTKGLDSGLKNAESKATGSSDRFGEIASRGGERVSKALDIVGKATVGIVSAGVGGMISLVKTSIESYAEYEQLVGGVETLFGNSSSQIMQYAQNAYKTAGLTANQYMEQATSFSASLLRGLGGDTAKAAQYADLAITDMADNANKMGTSIESIQWAYQGFAKQNYTMLDNLKLGYGGTASEMARLINDTGVMGAGFKATSKNMNEVPFDKVIEGIHKVQEKLGFTGTTAKEAATTIQGSFGMMQAAWGNLMIGLGDKNANVGQLIGNLIDSAKTFVGNVKPIAQEVVKHLPEVFQTLSEATEPLIEWFMSDILPPMLSALGDMFGKIGNKIMALLHPILKEIGLAVLGFLTMGLLVAIFGVIPLLIAGVLGLLFLFFPGLLGFFGQIFGFIGAFIGTVVQFFAGMIGLICTVVGAVIGFIGWVLSAIFNIIVSVISGVIGFITGVLSVIFDIVTSVISVIADVIGFILPIIFNVMSVIFGVVLRIIGVVVLLGMAIVQFVAYIVGFILGIVGSILGFIGGILGAIFNVVFGVVSTIVNFIAGVIGTIFSILGAIAGWIFNNVIMPVVNFFVGFCNYIFRGFVILWNTLCGVIGAIAGWIFNNVIIPVANFFVGLWNGVVNGVRGMFNAFCGIIGAIAGWVFNNVIRPIGDFFVGLWNGILSGITGLRNGISQAFGVIVGIVKAPINTIIGGVNKVIGKLNSLRIPDWVPGIGGMSLNFPYIPRLYTGGIVEPSGAIIRAGDGGESEWVVPESKMASLVEKLEARRNGGGDNITININGTFATSASEQRKVAEQIFEQLEIIKRKRLEGSL